MAFLDAPGEMSELIRAFAWEGTALGSLDRWPTNLRVTVGILLSASFPMLLWWGADSIQIYNDAYARALGAERHPSALGRCAKQTWGDIWEVIEPQIEQVMSGRGATYHEDRLVSLTRNGRREDVYWTYSCCPVDGDGKIDGVLVISTDVTQQHHDMERARNLSAGLLQLFQQAPNFVAVLRGPEHVYQFVNDHYKALLGDRDFIGKPVREVVPDVAGQGFFELLDGVFQTGQPFNGRGVPMKYRPAPGAPMVEVAIDLSYQAIVGPGGKVFGIYVDGRTVDPGAKPLRGTTALMDAELSPRETEVLRWTAAGKTAAEIAVILDISGRTVEFHINSAARKLDTVNRIQTVVEAMRKNLLV